MAERFGFNSVEDALVTLLNANLSDLNNGLALAVQQIATENPSKPIMSALYPSIYIYFDSADFSFRGASKRKDVVAHYQIHCWTYDMSSRDVSKDEMDLLVDNLLYIFSSKVDATNVSSTKGYLNIRNVSYEYSDENGFVTHAIVTLDMIRILN